jgi:AraC family transcriptional regulator of adaptative response / DNA-3-methyladenine glycosylase II
MDLDRSELYRALAARDARFDGLFFVGVSSTGVYCRPVCTARTPREENCSFHPSAAAAERAGFRPCLLCRPELAPGRSRVDVVGRLADAAVRRLEDGIEPSEVAKTLGVTDRHLRRAVVARFGVPPVALAQTGRLLTAKRLLTDTALPVGEVALASGFSSVRRMNTLFRERYHMSPTDLRRKGTASGDTVRCRVPFRPPYAWDAILDFLGKRAIERVETVVGGRYVRAVENGWIAIGPVVGNSIAVECSASLAATLPKILRRVRRLFDTEAEPLIIAEQLGDLAAKEPGLRLPGAWDGFEIGVRAILGQQVSVAGARTVAGRLAGAFGTPIETPWPVRVAFPSAARMAIADPNDVAALGIIGTKARAIVALAQAMEGGLRLTSGVDPEETQQALQSIKGIGPWTANYIAMRALGYPDAFPAGDLMLMRALGANTPAEATALVERYRPWRAYAAIHLWKTLSSPLPSGGEGQG